MKKSLTSYTRLRKTPITQNSVNINTTTKKFSASAIVFWEETKIFFYPSSESNQDLANDLKIFFIEKIQKIRTNLKSQAPTIDSSEENYGILDVLELPPSKLMHNFTPVNYKEVIKLVKSSPSKSCELDPIPTGQLKGMITELAPLIAVVVNSSLPKVPFHPH